jgi:Coenzyme PQQ synthesis protein D (PqqD)
MGFQRRADLRTRVVDGETIVLDRQQGSIHQLNPTASAIWACCDGQASVEEIAAAVQSAFEISYDIAVRDVRRLFQELEHHQLVVRAPDPVATVPDPVKEATHESTRGAAAAGTDDSTHDS